MTRYREPNHGETDQSRYPEQNECFVSKKLLRKESLHAHQHDNDRGPRLSGGMSSNFGRDIRDRGKKRQYPLSDDGIFGVTKLVRREKGPRLSGGMSSGFGTDMTGERNADK